jgi:predicted alpha-1,6-mannanase (GH76 family)
MMDLYFPDSAWLRLRRSTVDALARVKSREALPTWDETLERVLKQAGESGP